MKKSLLLLLGATLVSCNTLSMSPAETQTTPESTEVGQQLTFVHPGLLLNVARLDRLKTQVNSTTSNITKQGWTKVTSDSRASSGYTPHPYSTVHVLDSGSTDEERDFKDDPQAAYLNALQWVVTGKSAHKDASIRIMRAWAQKFQSIVNVNTDKPKQVDLEAAWVLPMWVNAAEIIRYHNNGAAGWSSTDIQQFDAFVNKLYNYAWKATIDTSTKNNWTVSGAYAMMSAGVYLNDTTKYQEGMRIIKETMPKVVYASGEIYELKSRDCYHPQYSLTGLVQAANVAWVQNDNSIYNLTFDGQTTPRLVLGMEYIAKAILSGSGVRNCSPSGADDYIREGYGDIALNRYGTTLLPNFYKAVLKARPEDGSDQFLGWTTATFGKY